MRSVKKVELSPDGASYVIGRLANLIQSATKEVQMAETNLEHILPRNPEANGWGSSDNQSVLEPLTWVIGNLTIYGKRKNTKAANKEFTDKKAGYLFSEVKMTNTIPNEFSQWDANSIFKRAEQLAPLVVRVWDFDNPSRV